MPRFLPLMLLLLPCMALALPELPAAPQHVDLPELASTELYTRDAKDCHDVDLSTWRHPTRTVLEKSDIKVDKVQLCNGGHYPIFHVQLPYDPQGQTNSFFVPLYHRMKAANGKWPYAIVDTRGNTVVYVSYDKNGEIELGYEMYAWH